MEYSNKIIFFAELVGTFGLVVAATGSIAFDGLMVGVLGPVFIAAMHFIGLTILVYGFSKYSMAHFNPAVTIGFAVSGYTPKKLIPIYFTAQAIGALLGSIFVKYAIGDFANIGLNFPDYSLPIGFLYGIEILATVFLMGVILIVVSVKKFPLYFVGICIGGIIALDVFFLGPISGASMNPMRSLAPALVTGIFDDLWLYLTAPFIGSFLVGLVYRKKYLRLITR